METENEKKLSNKIDNFKTGGHIGQPNQIGNEWVLNASKKDSILKDVIKEAVDNRRKIDHTFNDCLEWGLKNIKFTHIPPGSSKCTALTEHILESAENLENAETMGIWIGDSNGNLPGLPKCMGRELDNVGNTEKAGKIMNEEEYKAMLSEFENDPFYKKMQVHETEHFKSVMFKIRSLENEIAYLESDICLLDGEERRNALYNKKTELRKLRGGWSVNPCTKNDDYIIVEDDCAEERSPEEVKKILEIIKKRAINRKLPTLMVGGRVQIDEGDNNE